MRNLYTIIAIILVFCIPEPLLAMNYGKLMPGSTSAEIGLPNPVISCIAKGNDTSGNTIDCSSNVTLNDNGLITIPTSISAGLWFGDGDTGLYESSDDTIIIIEAKSNQPFEKDQMHYFEKDRKQLKELEIGIKTVCLVGLTSSKYDIPQVFRDVFDGPCLTWLELAKLYKNDRILNRADEIFEPGSIRNYGQNNKWGYMTGTELVELFKNGKNPFIGRGGGLHGTAITKDLKSGSWRNQRYETNHEAQTAPNENWFRLGDFIRLIGNI